MTDLTQNELVKQFSEMSPEAFRSIYPPDLTEDARSIYYAEETRRDNENAAGLGQAQQEVPSVESKSDGIRRLPYWLGVIGANFLFVLFRLSADSQATVILGLVISASLVIFLTAKRLHNMGASGWWSMLLFVPIVGVITIIFCGIVPEGDFRDRARVASPEGAPPLPSAKRQSNSAVDYSLEYETQGDDPDKLLHLLASKGYRTRSARSGRWSIREPLGGIMTFRTIEELRDYALNVSQLDRKRS